ncbi:ribonuclease G [Bacillus oleivorans]|uniref:Ribonuclease G n=1 Tax=Bacillus oleivorans TaxID=1448271 RepID=A0A285CXA5_9BACI|nr:Rne/Rng family ribonuclease [Bacillus oleivorans]SNX71583.1 ribonuclease G [Bacillus oleivorans]
MNELIINAKTAEQRFAFLQNKQLEHIHIELPSPHLTAGSICIGQVQDIIAGMNAAFIDIGEEKLGFIHRDDLPSYRQSNLPLEQKKQMPISKFLKRGEKIIIQVKKEPVGEKGARLTGLIEWPGTYLVYLPYSHYVAVSKRMDPTLAEKWRETAATWLSGNEGLIIRTGSSEQTEEMVKQEFEEIKKTVSSHINQLPYSNPPRVLFQPNLFLKELEGFLHQYNEGTIWVDHAEMIQEIRAILDETSGWEIKLYQGVEGIFSYFDLEQQIAKLLSQHVWLKNGASLTIDETEALTAIDVNTGKYLGKREHEQTVFKTNELAAIEAARQIRLRDLAGLIVIDFIEMEREEQKEKIRQLFLKETKKDHKTIQVGSFHELGVLILTRKRIGHSLIKKQTMACPVCAGAGRVFSSEALAFSLQREILERKTKAAFIRIQATSDIIAHFMKQPFTLKEHLEESLHLELSFEQIEHPHPFYRITRIDT